MILAWSVISSLFIAATWAGPTMLEHYRPNWGRRTSVGSSVAGAKLRAPLRSLALVRGEHAVALKDRRFGFPGAPARRRGSRLAAGRIARLGRAPSHPGSNHPHMSGLDRDGLSSRVGRSGIVRRHAEDDQTNQTGGNDKSGQRSHHCLLALPLSGLPQNAPYPADIDQQHRHGDNASP